VGALVRPRLCCVGGAVLDHYADLGLAFPGGNGVNAAVHASRSGAASSFVGVVGDDAAGRLIAASLEAEGVDVSRLRAVPGPTPLVTVRRDHGAFCCVACPRTLLPLTAAAAGRLPPCDLVHMAGTARADDLVPALAAAAPISYDFGRDEAGPGHPLLPLVTSAALSRPGMEEAEAAAVASALQQSGPRLVVVSCGAAGVTACLEGEVRHEAAAVGPVTDPLGAGDALLAHLLVCLLAGDGLEPALASASRYAAGVCGQLGGFGRGRPAVEVLGGR